MDKQEKGMMFSALFAASAATTLTGVLGSLVTVTEAVGIVLILSALTFGLWAFLRAVGRWLP